MNRKQFVRRATAAVLLAAGLGTGAMAQPWPTKPITMIIPFPPGGTLDVVGRMLAQKLGQQLGQTVIVDNRPGGAGTIGAHAVAHAPGRRLHAAVQRLDLHDDADDAEGCGL
jgi:tripartite-type tricarboxylate transporter receptor subunit TctC